MKMEGSCRSEEEVGFCSSEVTPRRVHALIISDTPQYMPATDPIKHPVTAPHKHKDPPPTPDENIPQHEATPPPKLSLRRHHRHTQT